MLGEIESHVVAGALLIASATVALCLGHLGETAYLAIIAGGSAPAALKGLRS